MTQTDIFTFLHPPCRITKPIRLIELFAGVGTQAMALRDLGANFTRWKTCEWDYHAILSYAAIHCGDDKTDYSCNLCDSVLTNTLHQWGISADGKKPMELASIKSLPNSKKREIYNAIMATHNMVNILSVTADDLSITDTDRYEYIMTYSYPCQDVSVAGKQKGMEKGSGTRSSLLWEVERILKELQERSELPQVLVMENVPDVISERNRKDFDQWYASLERMGYQSYYKLLNAKDYGVPQNRNRCFMVSVLGNYSYAFPNPVPLEKRLRDVLEPEVEEKYYLSGDYIVNLLQRNERQKNKGNGHLFKPKTENDISNAIMTRQRGSSDDTYIIQNGHGYNKGGVKEICPTITTGAFRENNFVIGSMQKNAYKGSLDGCCPTLTQAMGAGGGQIPMVTSERIRKLTPLECWRLMDYTDEDFYKAQAVNSNTQLYKQAGNGIVRSVLMAIFKELIEQEDHMKPILDVCCGSRMFYFDRDNPLVHFNDIREISDTLCDGRKLEIHPATRWDFRHLPIADNTYHMVVFDPPHLLKVGESSWLTKKYGKLPADWKPYLKQGFDECMRVLMPYGTLIFKWNETDIKLAELFEAIGTKPVFGDRGRGNKTYWFVFMKESESDG